MIAVRDYRHTFSIIEKAADFTVSVPSENMPDEIMFCGTESGRDVNKFERCKLHKADAQTVHSPIIDVPVDQGCLIRLLRHFKGDRGSAKVKKNQKD